MSAPAPLPQLSRPRAILFDWDNTLIDNWPAIHDALNTTFAAMGHPQWTLEETRARVRASLRDSFPLMFGDAWKDARHIFYRRYAAIHLECLHPFPAAGEVLEWLAGQEIWLGVVSNKNGRYLREEASVLGWDRYFGRIVGAGDAARDKPACEPVHMALDGSGLAAGTDVWFIGDGAIDIECAAGAGLTPVVLVGPRTAEELARHNVDQFLDPRCRVRSLASFKDLVLEALQPILGE